MVRARETEGFTHTRGERPRIFLGKSRFSKQSKEKGGRYEPTVMKVPDEVCRADNAKHDAV